MSGYDISVTDMKLPATRFAFGIAITGIEDDNPDRAYGRESLDFTREPFPREK